MFSRVTCHSLSMPTRGRKIRSPFLLNSERPTLSFSSRSIRTDASTFTGPNRMNSPRSFDVCSCRASAASELMPDGRMDSCASALAPARQASATAQSVVEK